MIDPTVFEPVQAEPAYRLAARTMREKILSGAIEVGQSLPSELALAELLRVNRSTIREAIRLLEENGMVTRKPGGKKLFVSVPNTKDVAVPVTGAMILQQITLNELYRTMLVVEPSIAADAAREATPEHAERLAANVAETKALGPEDRGLAALDIVFHDLLAEACGNRAIQLCRQPIVALFYPAFDAVMRRLNAGARMLAAHRHVADAVAAGDAARAEDWMRRHIEDFRRGYELANLDIDAPIHTLRNRDTDDAD